MVLETKNPGSKQEFLQITKQDKFYSRLLSKETSLANQSFRVYYGGASGAVPFLWESQPGTPKNTVAASTVPPLTPPPSYHTNPKKRSSNKSSPKSNSLMQWILARPSTKKTNLLYSSPSVSSSGSSSASHQLSRFSSPQSSFDDNEPTDEGSPTSILSNRVSHDGNGGPRGWYSMVIGCWQL